MYLCRLVLNRFNMKKFTHSLLVILLLVVTGCTDKTPDNDNGFDRTVMLQHFSGNIIQPAFRVCAEETETLKHFVEYFIQNPDEPNLKVAQEQWKRAFELFQYIRPFTFGPAAEQGVNKSLAEELGTFPVNVTATENYINTNDTLFNNFARDTRGFLALEYLLFGNGNNTDVLNSFADLKRKRYALAVANQIFLKIRFASNDWQAYGLSFVANNGTDAGSSVSLLYNEFLKSYELIKNYKVGLPSGNRPGQTQPEPQKVECYYSKQSVYMIKRHFEAVHGIWLGKGLNGADGAGFKEYLSTAVGGIELIAETEKQVSNVNTVLSSIDDNADLSQLINANSSKVSDLNTELQKLTRYYKSDMSSVLGIAITYTSGDGD